jgi:cell volume regulation protein A
VNDLQPYGVVLAVVALALLVAIGSSRITTRIGLPAPLVFLVAAAVASDVLPRLRSVPIVLDQRIVTVALVVILFDGGMHIGWRRFRASAAGILWLGVAGTVVTALALALAAHYLFDFGWHSALLLGTALAPTDPAVVFSVLGGQQIPGRTGTLLEGESGANDPVGIALMVSLLGASGGGWGEVGHGAGEFLLQLLVGGVVGAVGGWLLVELTRRSPLPNTALYPVRTIAFALLIYGVATACHGSGYLAVLLAGILLGDEDVPHKRDILRFSSAITGLAEIVAFTVLGLSISAHDVLFGGQFWTGLALAGLLILLVRPALVGLVLWPIRLAPDERIFVLWSGLKGAVPILLGTYVVGQGVHDANRIYQLIVIVVAVSVLVQGILVPRFVPRRPADPDLG